MKKVEGLWTGRVEQRSVRKINSYCLILTIRRRLKVSEYRKQFVEKERQSKNMRDTVDFIYIAIRFEFGLISV